MSLFNALNQVFFVAVFAVNVELLLNLILLICALPVFVPKLTFPRVFRNRLLYISAKVVRGKNIDNVVCFL